MCLAAADLAAAAARLEAALGVKECYRDPNVGKYGLENVLFPVGGSFLEIVSPTRDGTAVGRFLERHGGRHGYMVILDCDDPERRQRHVESLGVRIANVIRHGAYLGVQLHPKDTGAAMIEFNRTEGGEDASGPYAPAGPAWQRAVRTDVTRRLRAVEIECPDPDTLASLWGRILERPARSRVIRLDDGELRFLPGAEPALAAIELAGKAPPADLCGVRFRSVDV